MATLTVTSLLWLVALVILLLIWIRQSALNNGGGSIFFGI
jgi:hypothetical protein